MFIHFYVLSVSWMLSSEDLVEFECFVSLLGSMECNWQRCHLLEPGIYIGVKECVVGFLMQSNR